MGLLRECFKPISVLILIGLIDMIASYSSAACNYMNNYFLILLPNRLKYFERDFPYRSDSFPVFHQIKKLLILNVLYSC